MAYYKNDWDAFGRNLEDIIDQAINSQDFQKLNQTITQAVNRAVDTGSDAIRRAVERKNGRMGSYYDYVRKEDRPSPQNTSRPVPQQPPKPANLPVLYGSTTPKTLGGIAKTVGGTMIASAGAVTASVQALAALVLGSPFFSGIMALAAAGFAVGSWLVGSGVNTLVRLGRFQKYRRAIGQDYFCDLNQLSRAVNKPLTYVKKDLKRLISDGLLPEGHLNKEETHLITSDAAFREVERHRLELEAQQKKQALEEKLQQERMAKNALTPQVQEVLDKGNAFLRQIRSCNDAIPGEEISGKISRMENIVQKIFERAEAHPEIVPDLKKMMDYYLPMTVKLLNAYADMDRQPIQGETIRNSKLEIEATLDTLNSAFERLLDSVFKETAMDVSSDISVLQTLLAQEGLTDDEFAQIRNNKKP